MTLYKAGKVIGRDGAPIKTGDIVWNTRTREYRIVKTVRSIGAGWTLKTGKYICKY